MAMSDDDATEDEDDLDAPPKSRSQTLSQPGRKSPPRAASSTPDELPFPKANTPPAARSKVKGFRIGGKAKQAAAETPLPDQEDHGTTPDLDDTSLKEPSPPQTAADVDSTPKKAKRTFKIGGKGKGGSGGSSQIPDSAPLIADRTRDTPSPSVQPPSSPPPGSTAKDPSPVVQEREETAEQKAERRRAELKRNMEEAAKKQAQSKKKRRF
jgi:hypothetical protein